MSSFDFNRLLLFFVGLIVYGSLFPFDFTWTTPEADVLAPLYHIDADTPRWGDIISNVLLFIPYGFLGMALSATATHRSLKFALISLAGIALAFGLQCAQMYLPTRYPSLLDALCNGFGIFLGGLLFLPLRANAWPALPTLSRIEFIACGLIGAWILDYLWPLIPALDIQTLKDGLKPLIMHSPTSGLKTAMTAISWMLILHLWEFIQKKPVRLIRQIEAVTLMSGLEIVMEANALQWEEVLGAILALIAWNWGIRHSPWKKEMLIILLTALLVWKGLSPFIGRDIPVSFHWMPLGISIMGEPLYQLSVIIQKIFLYGSLAWLLLERRTYLPWALALSVGTLLSIEIAQRFMVEHTPEITDPFLVFLLILIIDNAFQRQHTSQTQASRHFSNSPISLSNLPSQVQTDGVKAIRSQS